MSFTSGLFLIGILPFYMLFYVLIRKNIICRKLLLFLANAVFYFWGGVKAFLIMCAYVLLIWMTERILCVKKSKALFAVGIAVSLLPLLTYKYLSVLKSSGLSLPLDIPELAAPLGISFFTFEAISLISDVYNGKITKRLSILEVFLYLSFFVTVTSGPILRYGDFNNDLAEQSKTVDRVKAIERIAVGLCKKMLIANKLSFLTDYYFNGIGNGEVYSCTGLWLASIAYSLQLYFDFSGYSDMAIGIGGILGFEIPENFNNPYHACSIQDFWRRWHITLSRWFRDYIYIPLGGNRCSKGRSILNLFIVWLLTGIWHGADWTFILWGLGYFVLLLLEKNIPFIKNMSGKWYGYLYTLFMVNFLWIPFRASDMHEFTSFISQMFRFFGGIPMEEIALNYLPFVIFVAALCLPLKKWIAKYESKAAVRWGKAVLLSVAACLALCAVINSSYAPYIYGKF